ncbi:MAG: long-chain fatty acid--CoA ligase, partial [Pseudomonadota bacterium]|nr:long-chain fatty acid--CoA ligase [Pseudomonadota bacterium]
MLQQAPSLTSALRAAFERHAGRTALLCEDAATSYAELAARVDRFARALRDWGVARGEPVALLVDRSADAVALFFGVMQAGGCPCFLEPRLSAAEIGQRLAAVGVRRLVLQPTEIGDAALLETAVSLQTVEGLLIPKAGPDAEVAPLAPLAHSDRSMMQFTSGSTGQPKGVLLSHGNLLANAAGVLAHTGVTPDDRLLHLMPLHHTNGVNNQLIVPLLAGASVVLVDRFRAERIAAQVAHHRPTYLTGVPTMFARMLPHLSDNAANRAALASLRFLRCGSAPITRALHTEVEAAFGVPLVVSYGLSEATCTT